jgi:hypothetical protein
MSMKNFKDTIGNGTCDLPACRAVPQPTALPRAPQEYKAIINMATVEIFEVIPGILT